MQIYVNCLHIIIAKHVFLEVAKKYTKWMFLIVVIYYILYIFPRLSGSAFTVHG